MLVSDSNPEAAELIARQHAKSTTPRILHKTCSLGFGGALRAGLQAATKNYVGIVAADARLAAEDVNWLTVLAPRCDIVCGYRIDRQDNWLRRTASKAYSILADVLLGTNVRDCNGALKLFRRDVLEQLDPQSDSVFINAELLSKARLRGLSVVEVDVTDRKRDGSPTRLSPRKSLSLVGELVSSWWNTVMFPTADAAATDSNASTVRPGTWHC